MKDRWFFIVMCSAVCFWVSAGTLCAATQREIKQDVDIALRDLYASVPGAQQLGDEAEAILVFPNMTKAGLIIGGQYGTGMLTKKNGKVEYYRSASLSYGLQIGAQQFGYALFFMNKESLYYLEDSDGWEVGTCPSIVLIDKGASSSLSTMTAKKGVYCFFFDHDGLMAGIGLQGTKIWKYYPDEK